MKTKIHFGLIALAVLGLSSCVKETTLDQANPDTPIVFDTYLGRAAQTKGYVADLADLQTTGFGVYAFYTATENYSAFQDNSKVPDYMVNEELTYSGGKWTYSPIKYWPNNTGDKVSFFAYAPYFATGSPATENITSVSAKSATGNPTVSFTVASEVVEQKDLLYAFLPDQLKPNMGHETTFNFKHALSRIGFKAQAVVDVINGDTNGTDDDDESTPGTLASETKITINSITLSGKFHTSGTLDLTNGMWNSTASSTDVNYKITDFQPDVNVLANTNISTLLNKEDEYIMIIPNKNSSSNSQIPVKVTVDYDVTTSDPALQSPSTIKNIITSDTFNFDFEQGKAYTFVLHLGLKSVEFSVNPVENWTEQTDDAVNAPLLQ